MTKLKAILFGAIETNSKAGDGALAFTRAALGIFMLVGHGFGKLHPDRFARFVKSTAAMGFPLPTLFAGGAVAAETLFALLLAVGLVTRVSAGVLSFNMLVAAFVAHAANPWFGASPRDPSKEAALLYLVPFLLFTVLGGGRYSADRFAR